MTSTVRDRSSPTPPGRSAYVFTYIAVDEAESCTPPDVDAAPDLTRYRYYLDRQLKHVIRPGGDSLVFAFDSAGRAAAVNFDRGLITFGYHPTTGNLQTITARGGNVLSYTYDGPLPLTETWSGEVSGSVSVAYTIGFRVTSQTVNARGTVTYRYDYDGLLTRAGELAIVRRPDDGLISGTTLGSISTEQNYNELGELGHLSARFGGSELYRAEYTRDDLGRITALTEAVQGVTSSLTFAYDESGRLKQVTRDGLVVEAYEYDANGNRLRATYPTGTVVGTYDAQDRLVSYGGATYTFAPSGELALKVEGSDTTRYTYDQLGNLVRVELPDGREIEYVIDGRNRRVGRKVDGVLTHGWLYQDQFNPVAELDASGNVVARFVYGTRPNVPDYMVRGGRTYRFITDHLGSVRLVVDVETGVVVQRLDYDAYGRVLLDTNPGFQPFGFAGGIYDPATGLVRFGARDYDPHTGRWTSKDPIGFEGGDPNLYGYVLGDPVNLVDPDGYLPLPIALSLLGGGINGAFRAISAALGCSDENVWSAFGKGFLSGALGTAASLPVGGRLITYGITALAAGAVGGFAEAFVGDVLLGDDVSFSDYIWSTGMGALGGRAGHSAFRINPGWAVPDWWAWRPPRKWTSYPRKLAGQEATSGMVEGAGSLLNDCLCK